MTGTAVASEKTGEKWQGSLLPWPQKGEQICEELGLGLLKSF